MNELMYSPITLARPAAYEVMPAPHTFGTSAGAWRLRSAPRQLAGVSVLMLWLLIFLLSWAPQGLRREHARLWYYEEHLLGDDNLVELSPADEPGNVEITSLSKKAEMRRNHRFGIRKPPRPSMSPPKTYIHIRPSRTNIQTNILTTLLRTVPEFPERPVSKMPLMY